LFAYLASIAPARHLAWDCGTGNGQAAVGLAQHFERVVATDASAEQIELAMLHPRVEYRIARSEDVALEPGSVDLVTAAVAVHWFDLPEFYATVRRVAATGGVLAVWTYHLPVIDPAIDPLLYRYYHEIVGPYWPERLHYLEEKYVTLPFPFDEIAAPAFAVRQAWRLDRLAGFLGSWSATRRYHEERGEHPLERVWPELTGAWGDVDREWLITWPLHMRVGRVA